METDVSQVLYINSEMILQYSLQGQKQFITSSLIWGAVNKVVRSGLDNIKAVGTERVICQIIRIQMFIQIRQT